MGVMISGTNSGCILSPVVKARVKSCILDQVQVVGCKGEDTVVFYGLEWKGEPLVQSSSKKPYEACIFKSLDGAIAELLRVGLTDASIKITTKSDND